ncbi:MAG: hypothetical protein FWD22_01750 [Treponema sp.]|nr:hypothetical protein [Treponema sp.]
MEWIFLVLVFPFFIYWCIDEKVGLQLGITIVLSIWVILIYKHLSGNIPVDIDFSWIIFAVFFCGFLFLRKKIEELLTKGGFRTYMIASAAVSFIMIMYIPDVKLILPAGIMLGLGAGYCFNKRFIGFKSSVILQKKIIPITLVLIGRFLIGTTGLALIVYRVEKIIIVISENQNIFLYCFLCCTIISLWVSVLAPWIFLKLRLGGAEFDTWWDKKNDK